MHAVIWTALLGDTRGVQANEQNTSKENFWIHNASEFRIVFSAALDLLHVGPEIIFGENIFFVQKIL